MTVVAYWTFAFEGGPHDGLRRVVPQEPGVRFFVQGEPPPVVLIYKEGQDVTLAVPGSEELVAPAERYGLDNFHSIELDAAYRWDGLAPAGGGELKEERELEEVAA